METESEGDLTREQRLLMEIRDKLCGGNAAQLARAIGKDATYVNRLFYPPGKPGRKGIGLEIMTACNREFFLPLSFWRTPVPPALNQEDIQQIHALRAMRHAVAHGKATEDQKALWFQIQHYGAAAGERAARMAYELQEKLSPGAVSSEGARSDDLPSFSRKDEDFELPMFSRRAESVMDGVIRQPAVMEPKAQYPTMQPILSWMHEDDLPDGEFAMVPRLKINLSAGPGKDQVAFEFNEAQPQAFRAEWIRQQHLKPKKLAAMTASGDSMEPTIHDGDSLLVDTGQVEVTDGKVYALWYEGGERVKRLWRMPGGGLRIRSDNAHDHPEILLGPEYLGHVRIIGRVVHRSGQGGL